MVVRIPWKEVFVDEGNGSWRPSGFVVIGDAYVGPRDRFGRGARVNFLDFDAQAGHDLEVTEHGTGVEVLRVF